jgi:putative ABC transport system permease protein
MSWVILKLTWANLTARPLANILTILTLSIAIILISILLQFSAVIDQRLSKDTANIDLIVGAKGSPLQLMLSSLFHIDVPTGNIPLGHAQALMKHPQIKTAVPLALGDSFRGYRLVGTKPDFLDLYEARLQEGKLWSHPQEVVIGARVQKELGLNIGQKFITSHGLSNTSTGGNQHQDAPYIVTGIIAPTNSVLDRLIITSADSIWHAHSVTVNKDANSPDHDEHENHDGRHVADQTRHDEHEHKHDDKHDHDAPNTNLDNIDHDETHEHHSEGQEPSTRGQNEDHDHALTNIRTVNPKGLEITALLVQYRSPIAAARMPALINQQKGLQAASPATEITRLFRLSDGFVNSLQILGGVLAAIGGMSIFVTMSNTALHKTYDIALLRSMGAKRTIILLQQVTEGLLTSLLSGVIGISAAHLLLYLASRFARPLENLGINGSLFPVSEYYLFGASLIIGILASLWPAIRNYQLDPIILLKKGR